MCYTRRMKDIKRISLAKALGFGEKAKEMGNSPVSEVFSGLTSGALKTMEEMERSPNFFGGPEM